MDDWHLHRRLLLDLERSSAWEPVTANLMQRRRAGTTGRRVTCPDRLSKQFLVPELTSSIILNRIRVSLALCGVKLVFKYYCFKHSSNIHLLNVSRFVYWENNSVLLCSEI